MPRNLTTIIDDTQCIGDSLVVINNNYENLDTAVGQLSSKASTPITTNNPTSTIQLSLNSNLNLTGNVRNNSITGSLLAAGNIIQITHTPSDATTNAANDRTDYTFPIQAKITPSNTQNKILIEARISLAAPLTAAGVFLRKTTGTAPTTQTTNFRSTQTTIPQGSACLAAVPQSNIPTTIYIQHLDFTVGSTSEVTYECIVVRPAATSLFINKSSSPPNFNTTSSITLYEIKS